MGLSDWSPKSTDTYWADQVLAIGNEVTFKNDANMAGNLTTIKAGTAKGRLIGGNLSVFSAITGSAYIPRNYTNTILFLEDVNEYSYSIDRMLTELHLAGVLGQISGFIWGTCAGCTDQGFTVLQVVQQHITPLGIPAFYGFQVVCFPSSFPLFSFSFSFLFLSLSSSSLFHFSLFFSLSFCFLLSHSFFHFLIFFDC
jgi:muramoyltetrapeptide carboxypeptidase